MRGAASKRMAFTGHAGFGLHYVRSEAEPGMRPSDGGGARPAKKTAPAVLTEKTGPTYIPPIDAAADA